MWNSISLWFWFTFPWWLMMSTTFSGVYWAFLGEISVQVFCPFLKLGYLSFYHWALRVLYILLLYISPLSDMTYKFVLLFLALSVYFLRGVPWGTKFLILMKSHLSVFSSVVHTFGPITCWVFLFIYLFFIWRKGFSPFFFLISWRLITLQYCSGFCHTLTRISCGFTCIPHPDPPSLAEYFSSDTFPREGNGTNGELLGGLSSGGSYWTLRGHFSRK